MFLFGDWTLLNVTVSYYKMRRWAFVVFMLGMLVLVGVLVFYVREVESYLELEGLEINQRVRLSGEVVSERVLYGDEKLLELDSGIVLICEGCGSYLDKEIFVEGVVEEYEDGKQVRVLKLRVINRLFNLLFFSSKFFCQRRYPRDKFWIVLQGKHSFFFCFRINKSNAVISSGLEIYSA